VAAVLTAAPILLNLATFLQAQAVGLLTNHFGVPIIPYMAKRCRSSAALRSQTRKGHVAEAVVVLGRVGQLEAAVEQIRQALDIQFKRIAAIQAQLDQLVACVSRREMIHTPNVAAKRRPPTLATFLADLQEPALTK